MTLPVELYPSIFRSLYNDRAIQSLASCSRVCQHFYLECHKLIFHRIDLNLEGWDAGVRALAKVLSQRKDIAGTVKDLRVTFVYRSVTSRQTALCTILNSVARLEAFSLDLTTRRDWDSVPSSLASAIDRTICGTTLTTLRFSNMEIPLEFFWGWKRGIKDLSLHQVGFRGRAHWHWDEKRGPVRVHMLATDKRREAKRDGLERLSVGLKTARRLAGSTKRMCADWKKLRSLEICFDDRGWSENDDEVRNRSSRVLERILEQCTNIGTLSFSKIECPFWVTHALPSIPLQTRRNLTQLDLSLDLWTSPELDSDLLTTCLDTLLTTYPTDNLLQCLRIETRFGPPPADWTLPYDEWEARFETAITPGLFPCLQNLDIIFWAGDGLVGELRNLCECFGIARLRRRVHVTFHIYSL